MLNWKTSAPGSDPTKSLGETHGAIIYTKISFTGSLIPGAKPRSNVTNKFYSEIMQFDLLKLFKWLATSNHKKALLYSRVKNILSWRWLQWWTNSDEWAHFGLGHWTPNLQQFEVHWLHNEGRKAQCDQMARLFFNIGSFITMKICPKA